MTGRVLDNIRVVDLTAWQAGPTVTMILGDFGAEVIKVEAPARLDGWRGGSGLTEGKAYERNPIWVGVNRNKLGLSLDLTDERGRDVFLKLVATADVLVENFTPRVMENFGLPYRRLFEVNPRLVMIALSGFGATGAWRDFSAFAFPTEEVSGLTYLNGFPGGPPVLAGQPVTDPLAGAMGAFAVVAALLRRERTGVGGYIDLSQIEALTTFIGGELIDAQLNQRDPVRRGNSRPGFVPHGVFPCQPPDLWVAIVARDDGDWARLCEAMERPDLLAREELAGIAGRTAHAAEVHEAVSAWTRPRTAVEVTERLHVCGVPVSPVMRPSTLMNDEQLWARGFFQLQDRAEVGTHPYPGPFVRLSATPGSLDRPAPLFGEHTTEILRGLGLSDAELQALDEAGVTSTTPLEQTWR